MLVNWQKSTSPSHSLRLHNPTFGLISTQRRIFIFGSLGYFNLGALLEGLRRLMSYKLALHVLVTFTEQVVPIHNHIMLL